MKKGKGWHKEWALGMLQSSGSAIIVLPAETLWPRHSRQKTLASYWPLSSHFFLSLAKTKPRSADLPRLETRLWHSWRIWLPPNSDDMSQVSHLACWPLSPWYQCPHNTQFLHPHGHRLEECPVSPENAQTRDKICAVRLELREVYTFTLKR